jgi:hypothetical protein
MARYLTDQDTFIRRRWAVYFASRVGKGRRVKIEELDEKLRARLDSRNEFVRGAALLYRHRKGESTVSARYAFEVGEALRDLGMEGESGPVALYASGHHAALIAFLAHLADLGPRGITAALDLFAALPIAVEPEVDILLAGHSLDFEIHAFEVASGQKHPLPEARVFLEKSLATLPRATLAEVWRRAYHRGHPLREIRAVAVREAFRIVADSKIPARARDAAWLILEEWKDGFNEPWPTLDRNHWLSEYWRWRQNVRTTLDGEREARIFATRLESQTPRKRASRDDLLKRLKAERNAAILPHQACEEETE